MPADVETLALSPQARMIGTILYRIGRAGTAALPTGLVLGLAIPPLAEAARPLFTPSILAMLFLALMRLDLSELYQRMRHPWMVLGMTVWILLITPVAVGIPVVWAGLNEDLTTALVLYAASPPVFASVAFALMLRLDASAALLVMVMATLLSPLTVPPIVLLLLGIELDLSTGELMLRLGVMIMGALTLAQILRRSIGATQMASWSLHLDGCMVITMTVFVVAIMDGVTARLLSDPLLVMGFAAAAFAVNAGLQVITLALTAPAQRHLGVTLAMISGHRNMGLLMAAIGATASPNVFIFFAMAQLPIYILPGLLRPIYQRLLGLRPLT